MKLAKEGVQVQGNQSARKTVAHCQPQHQAAWPCVETIPYCLCDCMRLRWYNVCGKGRPRLFNPSSSSTRAMMPVKRVPRTPGPFRAATSQRPRPAMGLVYRRRPLCPSLGCCIDLASSCATRPVCMKEDLFSGDNGARLRLDEVYRLCIKRSREKKAVAVRKDKNKNNKGAR